MTDTTIMIQDTGKYSTTSSLLAGEKRAYGSNGSAGTNLNLKNAQLSLNLECNINDNSVAGKKISDTDTQAFTFSEVDSNGIQQPQWVLNIVFNQTSSTDMITMGRLLYMCQTKGYKILSSSTGNGFYDMIAYCKYGQREADGESTKTVSSINVRIKGISLTQRAKGLIQCTLNLVETA